MGIWFKWVAVLCALLVAGCGSITSKFPVGTTAGLSRDATLIGTWKSQSDGKPDFYLHFIKSNDKMYAVWVATRINDDGDGGAILLEISTSKLGDNHFVNAQNINFNGKKDERYTVLLYRLDANQSLLVFGLDQDKVIEAFHTGKLTGKVESDNGAKNIVITAEPAVLDAFMSKPEAAVLFTPQMVLRRAD